MIRHIITILLSCAFLTGQAQELKSVEPSLNDYLPLLKAQGYMAYSFDTKDFNGAQAEPVVMEYVKGEEPKDVLGFSFSMNFGEKLVIGFAPSGNDSTAIYTFNFSEGRGFNGRLSLRAIYAPEEPTKSHCRIDGKTSKGGQVRKPAIESKTLKASGDRLLRNNGGFPFCFSLEFMLADAGGKDCFL